MGFKFALFLVALLTAGAVGAHTRIYTYVDADGVKHFTDVPDDNRYKLLILDRHELTQSGDHYSATLLARAAQYDSIIERAAVSAAVEPNLLRAVIVVESGFNSRAVSKRGAVGLMQLMPATAKGLGVADSFKPDENVRGGATYLDALLTRYHDNMALALASYNAGPEAVDKYHGIPPYRETQAYVARVIHEFNRRVLAREAEAKRAAAQARRAAASAQPPQEKPGR